MELYQETAESLGENGRTSSRSNIIDGHEIGNNELIEDPTADQLKIAMRLSEQQQLEDEQRRLLEEETFRQVLELSLTDK